MQIDFHYYCIFVLANLAGYSKEDAKIIAYSSQYVDDSLDSEPVSIGDFVFDTVRTAHSGLAAKSWSVSKKVHMPFHFIPAHPVDDAESFSYISQSDSFFARLLLQDAAKDQTGLHLYRIGIALHTYADTWAHQEFSGRSHKENNLTDLKRTKGEREPKCPFWWLLCNWATDLLYGRVGHLQALRYPDHSHGEWYYKKEKSNDMTPVSNTSRFMEAAEKIFLFLADTKGTNNAQSIWENNKGILHDLFLYRNFSGKKMLASKCRQWPERFPNFFTATEFEYDENEWKNSAMVEKDQKDI